MKTRINRHTPQTEVWGIISSYIPHTLVWGAQLSMIFLLFFSSAVIAETAQEEQYVNQLNYRRNKLEILIKTRFVSESNIYTSTDYSATTYTFESYSQTYGTSQTSGGTHSETKEITFWKIMKGGIRELTDADFLDTVGKHDEAANIRSQENTKSNFRLAGTILSVTGIGYMLWASGQDQGSAAITSGGIATAIGFLISAFNYSPRHYITSDYAQELIDNYNVSLKKKLGLPINFN